MTRPARILVWTLTSLFTLLAILVVVIATFDWNRVKPLLNEKVSEALHRPFAINGNLAVHWRTEPEEGGWRAWVPWPHFIAEDLTLGNPEWLKEPDMVGLARVEFRLAPLPLVFQQISIPASTLPSLPPTSPAWPMDALTGCSTSAPRMKTQNLQSGSWISAPSALTRATSASTTRP